MTRSTAVRGTAEHRGKTAVRGSAVSNGHALCPVFWQMDLTVDWITVSHALHSNARHLTLRGSIDEKFSIKMHY